MNRKSIFLGFLFSAALMILLSPSAAAAEADRYIVCLNSPLPAVLDLADPASPIQEVSAEHNLYTVTDPNLIDTFYREDLLVYAEPDYPVELFIETTAELEPQSNPYSWHLDQLGASHANKLKCFGQGVRVGIIDSGAYPHPEFADRLTTGYNFFTKTTDVTDTIGHGTFVAGLIGAADDGTGVSGVAPAATLIPLKAFDSQFTTTVAVIRNAIMAAVDEFDCKIINMSFGIKQYSQTLEAAINHAADAGCILVASVGNLGSTQLYYPAAFPNVIGVGAVDRNGTVASFSERNSSVLVVAPGHTVYSTTSTGEIGTKSGTSFSAPLISGILARLVNIDADLTTDRAGQLLAQTAQDAGDEGYDTSYGYGFVSLSGAAQALMPDTPFFLSPFYSQQDALKIELYNQTDAPLSGTFILTEYENGIMRELHCSELTVEAGQTCAIPIPTTSKDVKCCVWDPFGTIRALTCFRERSADPPLLSSP